MWPLNHWMMDKISIFLTNHEGCAHREIKAKGSDSVKMIIRDSFGYIYELDLKTLGRVSSHDPGATVYESIKEIIE